ncbi:MULTISPECIES: DUF4259 domain-containing protein [unclassified Kitasatospora]|uniref:DUF4259 domain-containing protein n=1 Tax=unclassified Kitasatospora TaxID=2633591 RepID=UPI0033FFED29
MGSWDTGPFHNDDAIGIAERFDSLFPEELPPFLHHLFDTAACAPQGELEIALSREVIAAAAVIASQLPGGATIDLTSGPRESVPALPSELRPKAVVALDRILVHADAEVGHWFDRAKGERWLANVVQIRLAIQDDPPPVINYTSAGPMATTPSVVAPIPQQAPTQPEAAPAEASRRRRRVFAGQQFVQGRLGVDEVWDLRDRHSEATVAHALAELVERQAGEVDNLDRELRTVASRAAEVLAPIVQGNHSSVQGNGVLRFTGVELETLGARFALARQELQNLVARYEHAATMAPAAPSRETAARVRSTARLTGAPTAVPAKGVLPAPHRPLHL